MATVQAPKNNTSEIEIFARLIKADQSDLSRELAHYILKLGFEEKDQIRMRELAEWNQDGRLTSEEREELENYVKAGHLLALLHSKARRSLRAVKLPWGIRGRSLGKRSARAGGTRLRVLPDARGLLPDDSLPARPYHRAPARRSAPPVSLFVTVLFSANKEP